MTDKPLTRQKAEAHEALYPPLERLTRQLEAMAARKPADPVPPAARAIAEDLLFEAQRFAGIRRGLPDPAADIGGLAIQLGRALAQLDAFEAAHTAWNPDLQCFVWLLRHLLPVKRLRPQSAAILKTGKRKRDMDQLRKKIWGRLEEKYEEGYKAGLRDGSVSSQQPSAEA